MTNVTIYTDGACSGNPGVGGWSAILISGCNQKKIAGAEAETTNNRMELEAVIQALLSLKRPCTVTLYSDSAYVINAFSQKWINTWQSNGWKTSNKKSVQNRDLWLKLIELIKIHDVTFIKVKGHSDNIYNNECDELARNAIKELKQGDVSNGTKM